jgi:hypothetical protein
LMYLIVTDFVPLKAAPKHKPILSGWFVEYLNVCREIG